MAKFKLFDESTHASLTKTQVDNKSIGAINNRLAAVKSLYRSIKKSEFNIECQYATELQEKFPVIFNLMEISIIKNDLSKIIKNINLVLNFWNENDINNKIKSYKDILPNLKDLQPYLDSKQEIKHFTITGNQMWELYIEKMYEFENLKLKALELEDELSNHECKDPYYMENEEE